MPMHTYFANWYSVAKPEPKGETLDTRWAAIETYTGNVDQPAAFDLVRLFYSRPAKLDISIETFRKAFKEADSAFLMRDNDLELRVLAGATIAHILDGEPSDLTDATALATVCAAYQNLRPQILLPDIVRYARGYLTREGIRVRQQGSVSSSSIAAPATPAVIKGLKTALTANNLSSSPETLTDILTSISDTMTSLDEAVTTSINSLATNSKIQQEETNILWWLFGEHSRDQELNIRDVAFPGVCLVAGKELADLTVLLPGPRPAIAFLDKMLRTAKEDLPESTKLVDAINTASREWRTTWIEAKDFQAVDDICPVHFAASKSLESTGATDWISAFESGTGLKARKAINPLHLSLQAYEEALLIGIAGS